MTDPARPTPSTAVSVRVRHLHRSRYDGQRRHDMRIGPQPKYVDEARERRNRVLVEPLRPGEMRDRADNLRQKGGAVRAMRADAAVATVGIITFGSAAQPIFERLTPDQQDAAYRDVAERIASDCGTTVRGLVVHCDEAAPHAHVTWDSRAEDGVAMSKAMKGSRLQDIAAEVMAEHAPGITRGERKADRIQRGDDASMIYHRNVRELHHDLPRELEELRADRDVAAARLEKNARLAEKAREKAQGDDIRAEKARRRAETYEKRTEDAKAEIARLDARSSALTAHEKRLDLAEQQFDLECDKLDDERHRLAEREANLANQEVSLRAEKSRLRHFGDEMGAAYDAAKELLNDLRSLNHLPRDVRKSLRDGIRDLRDALQPPKARTERDRINDQIVSQQSLAPDKSSLGSKISGPE